MAIASPTCSTTARRSPTRTRPTTTATVAAMPVTATTTTLYSVLQSTARRGPWEPPERMRLVSVMGNIVLDYRDAELPLGETTVECLVVMGSVEIIVPPDVDVELTGSVFLGAVETKGAAIPVRGRERDEEEERPLLTVVCSGTMGRGYGFRDFTMQ